MDVRSRLLFLINADIGSATVDCIVDIVLKAGKLWGASFFDCSHRLADKRGWCRDASCHPLWARIVVQCYRRRFVPCRLCRAVRARSTARLRYGSPQQSRSCGLHAASGAGRRRCRECRGRMRDRGMCEAHVDAIAAAPRQHNARRVPGRCLCGICQWPPRLGDGDRRRWWWWQRRRPRLFHRRQQRAVSAHRGRAPVSRFRHKGTFSRRQSMSAFGCTRTYNITCRSRPIQQSRRPERSPTASS